MKTSKTVVANFGLAGKYLKLESGGKPSELDICVKLGAYFDGEKRHELEKLQELGGKVASFQLEKDSRTFLMKAEALD